MTAQKWLWRSIILSILTIALIIFSVLLTLLNKPDDMTKKRGFFLCNLIVAIIGFVFAIAVAGWKYWKPPMKWRIWGQVFMFLVRLANLMWFLFAAVRNQVPIFDLQFIPFSFECLSFLFQLCKRTTNKNSDLEKANPSPDH